MERVEIIGKVALNSPYQEYSCVLKDYPDRLRARFVVESYVAPFVASSYTVNSRRFDDVDDAILAYKEKVEKFLLILKEEIDEGITKEVE